MKHRACIASLLLAWIGLASTAAAQYQVVELAAPPGAISVEALALNSSGDVAGRMQDSAGNFHPVVWNAGGAPVVLPLPPGYPGADATGISGAGTVVGTAWMQGSFGFSAAVRWQSGAPTLIPTLGGEYSAASGVSAGGVATGWTSISGQFTGQQGFRFESDIKSIGVLPTDGAAWTLGNAINASGQVVGAAMNGTQFQHAFLDDPAEGIMDIGTLGGLTSEALAISSDSTIAGWSQTGARDSTTFTGMVVHAFVWRRGVMTDLGTLPGFLESRALGVNAGGTVVGRCPDLAGPTRRAFRWEGGVMTDLNTLIPAGTDWILENANAVNDAGRIAGSGTRSGQRRAFLLIPNP